MDQQPGPSQAGFDIQRADPAQATAAFRTAVCGRLYGGFDPAALAVSGLDTVRLQSDGADPAQAMTAFRIWIDAASAGGQEAGVAGTSGARCAMA